MTKREADDFFGINCRVLTKPLNRIPEVNYSQVERPIRMLYTGNLLIGRDRSLLRVVNAIKQLPENSYVIDVYTQTELSDEKRRAIEDLNICRVHAPISQSEVLKKQTEADLLLFLEDIDGPDAHVARLSFSTKTTDYLSSGRAIFAVGCADTAPMQYFVENHAAVTATSDAEIVERLNEIVSNMDSLKQYAEAAQKVGIQNHSNEKILSVFNETVCSVVMKNNKK